MRGPLSGLRVLVADDDRIPRRMVAVAVARAGGEPTEAEDGAAALALVSSAPEAFDAAVLDFVMPGLDGADLVTALRAIGFAGPVIGITGAASDAEATAWVAAGCDEVLPKGCPMMELVVELAAAYRRRRNGYGTFRRKAK
ncbi:MAG TPA: response regulator [Planctomycetaceae bacterium]